MRALELVGECRALVGELRFAIAHAELKRERPPLEAPPATYTYGSKGEP